VLLSVIGAVQYGTSKVFYKIVPHFDAQEFRQYILAFPICDVSEYSWAFPANTT
jgi:hypothetical protein